MPERLTLNRHSIQPIKNFAAAVSVLILLLPPSASFGPLVVPSRHLFLSWRLPTTSTSWNRTFSPRPAEVHHGMSSRSRHWHTRQCQQSWQRSMTWKYGSQTRKTFIETIPNPTRAMRAKISGMATCPTIIPRRTKIHRIYWYAAAPTDQGTSRAACW